MAVPLHPILWASIGVAAAPLAFYIALIALGVIPFFQRQYVINAFQRFVSVPWSLGLT